MAESKWDKVANMYLQSGIEGQLNWGPNSKNKPRNPLRAKFGIGTLEGMQSGKLVFTPILRHLEDMTEEEVKEMHMAFFKYEDVDYSGNKIKARAADIREHEGLVAATKIKKGYHFGKRAVTLYYEPCDGRAGEICEPLHGLERGVWLISRGFDVFGLIEAGEAIRKEVEK